MSAIWVLFRRWFSFGCLSLTIALLPGRPATAEAANVSHDVRLSASWRLIQNLPENRFQAELTLSNGTDEPLLAPWQLYFNSARGFDLASDELPLMVRHVNGDLYVLEAEKRYPPIAAGEERVLKITGNPWAINVSDAPSGLYLVITDEAGNERPPLVVPLEIESFPDVNLIRRGGGDVVPVVTPEARFAANERMTLLPADELPPVLPTPIAFSKRPGRVAIAPTTAIIYEPPLESEARFLASRLRESFGWDAEVNAAPDDRQDAVRLKLGGVSAAGMVKQPGDEAYTLTARPDAGIEIVGTDPAGVFYGIQTFRALLPIAADRRWDKQLSIAAIEIVDAPRFRYRGLHLDVARNFQSAATVKTLLDLMAFYKLNRFHWHLTDDEGWRIEIKALPELTTVGGRRGHTTDEADHLIPSHGSGPFPDATRSPGSGYYSQAELIDILRFARERHIQVIPELDFPGHARAAIVAMKARARSAADETFDFQLVDPHGTSEYESVQMWRDNVVDVCQESTYRFLDLVVAELADVYRRAGLRLESIHLGGDEVPHGAWEKSPACRAIETVDGPLARGEQLQLHFLKQACDLLAKHEVGAACWEDCLLAAAKAPQNSNVAGPGDWPTRLIAYVWNNVWGWGREDSAYRLANSGYDVVLCNATHLYFDLACEKDPREPGYYWAGFVDARAPFEFNPFDVFQNARTNLMGQPIAREQFADRVRLSEEGRNRILGIQGQLWGETLRSAAQLEYMAFPRTIALAERAWAAEPPFATTEDSAARERELEHAWNRFANCLGQRELPRLDYLAGGVTYRIPPPGAEIRAGVLRANVAYPGLTIRYSLDGSEPTPSSPVYRGPIAIQNGVKLKTFDSSGRSSRTTAIARSSPTRP